MSSELQLDVCCLSCGGAIWWTLTKERQAWCCLQAKLCDPCLSALRVCVRTKMALYKYSSFPFPFSYIATIAIWKFYTVSQLNCRQNANPFNSITQQKQGNLRSHFTRAVLSRHPRQRRDGPFCGCITLHCSDVIIFNLFDALVCICFLHLHSATLVSKLLM